MLSKESTRPQDIRHLEMRPTRLRLPSLRRSQRDSSCQVCSSCEYEVYVICGPLIRATRDRAEVAELFANSIIGLSMSRDYRLCFPYCRSSPNAVYPSHTRHTNLSPLISFRLKASIAPWARSSNVAPSCIRYLLGVTTPSSISAGIINA